MYKLTILFSLILLSSDACTQNIFSALHLNENREYKTAKPKKITETITFYISTGKQIDKNVKTFDEAGMLLTEERFDEKGTLEVKLTYTNDTSNKAILTRIIERWTQFGYSKETAFYTYDSNHNLTGIIDKDATGNIIRQTNLVVNEKGHPTELALFDGNGNSFGKETASYLYDKNRVITSVITNGGKVLSTDTIKISFLKAFMFAAEGETYNSKGDLTRWTSVNFNGTVTEFEKEYLYDRFGNCIESRTYKVTVKSNGKRKKTLNQVSKKQYFYQ